MNSLFGTSHQKKLFKPLILIKGRGTTKEITRKSDHKQPEYRKKISGHAPG